MIIKLISLIPFWMLYILSDIVYYPLYYVFRYRREIVRKNLTESFPEKSPEEIISIEKRFYHFLIDMSVETCKLATISPTEMKRRMKFVNVNLVNDKLVQGKSISLFMGHYGNWEWVSSLGLWLDKCAVPVQVYHQLRNESMDKIIKMLRERFGHISIDMYQTAKFVAHTTTDTKPYIIGFIADQSPKRREAKHFMIFLNHNVPVLTGTEKLTKRYGYEALFLNVQRVKRGYYECRFLPLNDNPKALPDFELTKFYYQQLETMIGQHPSYYLWSHNRFKYACTK